MAEKKWALIIMAKEPQAGRTKTRLCPPLTAEKAADLIWSSTHLDAWRHLVVDRGWSPSAFRQNRLALIRRTVLA